MTGAGPNLCAEVRRHCAAVAEAAELVHIAPGLPHYTPGTAGLDPAVHLLDAPDEERARYVLVLDAVNFGSGWFPTLAREADDDPTTTMSRRLTEHARRRGAVWSSAELRAVDAHAIAAVLGQDPATS